MPLFISTLNRETLKNALSEILSDKDNVEFDLSYQKTDHGRCFQGYVTFYAYINVEDASYGLAVYGGESFVDKEPYFEIEVDDYTEHPEVEKLADEVISDNHSEFISRTEDFISDYYTEMAEESEYDDRDDDYDLDYYYDFQYDDEKAASLLDKSL